MHVPAILLLLLLMLSGEKNPSWGGTQAPMTNNVHNQFMHFRVCLVGEKDWVWVLARFVVT